MLGVMLCLAEFSAFVIVQLVDHDDIFSRNIVLARLNAADLPEFKVKGTDPIAG